MVARSTIVGVATGTPDGGVAIVRLSGPQAFAIAQALGAPPGAPRRLVLRALDGGAGAAEQALVVGMPAPHSFTGEDVVEFHVHAGALNLRRIVDACLAAGAVAAEPGAFTRRAFEHGRLALDQAEGIAALVGAQTQAAVDQARRLVTGELGRDIEAVLESLLQLRADIEARLDFPDDVDAADEARWAAEIAAQAAVLRVWLARYETGARARTRARVVLAGPPNAGKSSLFNALLGYARTLVAAEPGTTRDYVEAELTLGTTACVLVDTAGLHEVEAAIERAGIERAREQLEGADVVVWVEAADAEPVTPPAFAAGIELLCVESKRDLGTRRAPWLGVAQGDPGSVTALRERLQRHCEGDPGRAWIGLRRHRDRAEQALDELELAASRRGAPELVAFHLGAAHDRLAEIRGRSALGAIGEDVLQRIFATFCIGK